MSSELSSQLTTEQIRELHPSVLARGATAVRNLQLLSPLQFETPEAQNAQQELIASYQSRLDSTKQAQTLYEICTTGEYEGQKMDGGRMQIASMAYQLVSTEMKRFDDFNYQAMVKEHAVRLNKVIDKYNAGELGSPEQGLNILRQNLNQVKEVCSIIGEISPKAVASTQASVAEVEKGVAAKERAFKLLHPTPTPTSNQKESTPQQEKQAPSSREVQQLPASTTTQKQNIVRQEPQPPSLTFPQEIVEGVFTGSIKVEALHKLAKEKQLNLSKYSAQKMVDKINSNPKSKKMLDKARDLFHSVTANKKTREFKKEIKAELKRQGQYSAPKH